MNNRRSEKTMTFLHRLALLAVCSTLLVAGPAAAKPGTAEKGKEIYDKRCTWCHGAEGDGAGASKDLLNPPPRDFTSGNYKIKSSAFEDMVPSDDDVFRMIRDGMPGTAMAANPVAQTLRREILPTLPPLIFLSIRSVPRFSSHGNCLHAG